MPILRNLEAIEVGRDHVVDDEMLDDAHQLAEIDGQVLSDEAYRPGEVTVDCSANSSSGIMIPPMGDLRLNSKARASRAEARW